jgi:NAD(P)-dependent dehydrogenase (short-subunit alcohol dehydrogenase family)
MTLKGRNTVITGASVGFGANIAKTFVAEGANVLLCARGIDALHETVAALRTEATRGQIIEARRCDVTDDAHVAALAVEAMKLFPQVHAIVNNAGIYGPLGITEGVDWDEWKATIVSNLFGTVGVSRAFVPHFKSVGYGKIVNISGGGATSPLPRVSAYAASKAAVVRFTETLAEELKDWRIDVNAVAPGVLDTRLTRQLLDAGPEVVGKDLYSRVGGMVGDGQAASEKGAALCAYLASASSDGITGKLIAAVWDPWPNLAEHKQDLAGSDIYTLRRILPKDRGRGWGE